MVNRYDHRARTYEGQTGRKKYGRKPHIPHATDEQKADPAFEAEPRYWMLRSVAEARLREKVGDRIMIGFRDMVTPTTTQRATIGAILPRIPATDKLPVLTLPPETVFEFLGLFNATVFDFLVRGHLPGASVKKWILSQVPAPPPRPRPPHRRPRPPALADELLGGPSLRCRSAPVGPR